MTDMFTPEKRSEIMSHIRSKNTKAELIVFRYLRSHNIYFQKHYKRAPGAPDIALPRKKLAVFIDGDFWHGRNYEKIMKTHEGSDYWKKKISRNIERDKEQESELVGLGWKILRVWSSDIARKRTSKGVLETIEDFLRA